MPTRWDTFPVQVQGGLVTNISPLQQGLNEPGTASRLINFENSIQGGYRRINGYAKWDTNPVPSSDSSTQLLGVGILDDTIVVPREGSIYYSTGSGWTTAASGRTQTNKVRYTLANLDGTRVLIGTDGLNYPYTFDGTSVTNRTGTTDVEGTSFSVQFKDHIFYANDSLVTFTAPFTFDDFNTGNGAGSFRVNNTVTGMIVFRQRLFVFTLTSIFVLDGSSSTDFALTSVSEDIGCVQPDTIQEVAGDVAFLGPDGVRLLGATDRVGDFNNQLCSRRIQQNMLQLESDYTSFSSTVVREKSQYRIFGYRDALEPSFTDGYIGTQFEAQNPQSFAWSQTRGVKVYAADSKYFNDEEIIVFVSDQEYVFRMEQGSTFDGGDIVGTYWTPYISFNDPRLRKTLFRLSKYFDPENSISGRMNVNFNFDQANYIQPDSINFDAQGSSVVFGTAVYGVDNFQSSPSSVIDFPLVGSGRQARLEFEYDGSDPFVIDTILIEYATKGRV